MPVVALDACLGGMEVCSGQEDLALQSREVSAAPGSRVGDTCPNFLPARVEASSSIRPVPRRGEADAGALVGASSPCCHPPAHQQIVNIPGLLFSGPSPEVPPAQRGPSEADGLDVFEHLCITKQEKPFAQLFPA